MVEYIVSVYSDRTEWFNKNHQTHREDGPAVEWKSGDNFWFKNGRLHREDGPACEYANGDKAWYLDGKYYNEENFNKEIARRKGVPTTCNGKIVVIEGKKYKLTEIA